MIFHWYVTTIVKILLISHLISFYSRTIKLSARNIYYIFMILYFWPPTIRILNHIIISDMQSKRRWIFYLLHITMDCCQRVLDMTWHSIQKKRKSILYKNQQAFPSEKKQEIGTFGKDMCSLFTLSPNHNIHCSWLSPSFPYQPFEREVTNPS